MGIKRHKSWIYIVFLLVLVLAAFIDVSAWAQQDKTLVQNNGRLNKLMEAVNTGEIAYKLSEPSEIKVLLGKPQKEFEFNDGGMTILDMSYPDATTRFGKSRGDSGAPFTLRVIWIRGEMIDIGEGRQISLRNIQDLRKVGLDDADVRGLDLSGEADYLKSEDLCSLTQWPGPEKLPPGFDPQRLLEDGKNPGLGIRALHKEGIDGEGVGIAVLDQPLLLGHEEYSSRLVRYDATRSGGIWLRPQMHGSPIVSVAVGKRCGVAPRAFVFYYAANTTSGSGKPRIQADWINEIIKYNETAEDSKRIRVINISAAPDRALVFREARKKALDAGILVVTCAQKWLDYGTLNLIEGKDPDDPESYIPGGYSGSTDVLRVPVGNGTTASHRGIDVYTYYRQGGMSWAAPYIAGLAALAFQVNPDLQPQTIVEQLVKTATHTKAGPIVNPRGFIESIKRSK
ncbi:MAG: S8 family serine peptidase [Planctomycetota bacterium]|jgi:hypothetical protein